MTKPVKFFVKHDGKYYDMDGRGHYRISDDGKMVMIEVDFEGKRKPLKLRGRNAIRFLAVLNSLMDTK